MNTTRIFIFTLLVLFTYFLLTASTDAQEVRGILSGHTGHVYSVAFSPDGQTLASGSRDNTVRLWQLPLTHVTHVEISPSPVVPPAIGEQFTINLNIVRGENVGGYQATVAFDDTALRYVESANGDYLPGAFFVPLVMENDRVMLGATALAGANNGDGTLATLTFEVLEIKASILGLFNVILTDSEGKTLPRLTFSGRVAESPLLGDINGDGVVNVLDLVRVASPFGQRAEGKVDVNGDGVINIIDLVKVAGAIGAGAAAPSSLDPQVLAVFTAVDVQRWVTQAQQLTLTDATSQRGLLFLEQLLAALTPKVTALLPNYPNPFNPETWIPYQLAESADVSISIYSAAGKRIRSLALGHQPVGIYADRSRAAYWDGQNEQGELVASGVYFYTLMAGEFTATRKMLIRK